jgi:cadmium resistance protein CadD (predicted permease)
MSPDTKMTCGIIRAGHIHAVVLVILALIAQVLADYTSLNPVLEKFIRIGFPLAAILVSGGWVPFYFIAGCSGCL